MINPPLHEIPDRPGRFQINETGVISLKAGVALDFESQSEHLLRVQVNDGHLTAERDVLIQVSDVNEAPTAINFTNSVLSLPESRSTASPIKIADIAISDDALGSEILALTGADAGDFEIVGSTLYLRAGVALNFEAKTSYSVQVTLDDPSLGTGVELTSQIFALAVSDVNEVPGQPSFLTAPTAILERDHPVQGALRPAVLIGRFGASDPDAATTSFGQLRFETSDARFEIRNNNELWLKDGVALNFETSASVAIQVRTVDGGGLASAWKTETLAIADATDYYYGDEAANTLTGGPT